MYLVFISYSHGSHYNCVCYSPEEVQAYLEQVEAAPLLTADEVRAIEDDGENIWKEGEDSTWVTVTKASAYAKEQAFLSMDQKYLSAFINLQHYIRENEETHFLESFDTQEETLDHVYVQALLAEIAISGKVEVKKEVAEAFITMEQSGNKLPFDLYYPNADGRATEEGEEVLVKVDSNWTSSDGEFPASWKFVTLK